MDYYQINDAGNNLQNVPCVSGFGGVNFRLNSKRKHFLELAILMKENTIGLKLKQHAGTLTTNHDQLLLIPLRFGYPFNLSKKISFVINAGTTAVYKTFTSEGGAVVAEGNNQYENKARALDKDFYFLINGGGAMEWKFWKKLKFSAGVNYFQGLTKTSIGDITYQVNAQPVQKAEIIGRGTFLGYTFGLRYLLK